MRCLSGQPMSILTDSIQFVAKHERKEPRGKALLASSANIDSARLDPPDQYECTRVCPLQTCRNAHVCALFNPVGTYTCVPSSAGRLLNSRFITSSSSRSLMNSSSSSSSFLLTLPLARPLHAASSSGSPCNRLGRF